MRIRAENWGLTSLRLGRHTYGVTHPPAPPPPVSPSGHPSRPFLRSRAAMLERTLEDGLSGLLALLLAGLIGLIGTAIAVRLLAATALTFAEEGAEWLYLAIIFLAVPVAHGRDRYVAFTALTAPLRGPAAAAATALARAVTLWTTLQMLLHGTRLAMLLGGVSPSLQLPYGLLYGLVPLSGA